MINVINTPSLSDALNEAVNFCNSKTEDINIIVPDKLSLFMEKYVFEKLNIESSFNIKVNTLNRFAKRNITLSSDKTISEVGSILLIHKILNENINNLRVLSSKSYSFSYAEEIFHTIQQLKASKIYPQEMENFDSSNEQLKDKILDLSFIYEEYEKNKAGLLDALDTFLLSALAISDDVSGNKILFVGFDDFTAVEYTIIERLALSNDVYIFNYSSKMNNKYIYNSEIVSQLYNIANINEIPFKTTDTEKSSVGIKDFLTDNLFSTCNETITEKDEVKLFVANSLYSELDFVARNIREKIIEGKNFQDFGIAIFDLENKNEIIEEIFSKYEINYYIDTDFSLNKSIFYKFIVSMLKFNLDGYNNVNLIDMINSPFFKIDDEKKSKLCDALIKLNFRGTKFDWINFDKELKDEVEKLKEFVNLFIIDMDSTLEDVIKLFDNANNLLDIDGILNNLANTCVKLQDKILITKSKELVNNLFSEISKFYPNINIRDLFDIFSHVANVIKINNLPQTIDAVKIVDAYDCLEIFNNLYLVNCTNENAPKIKSDCGIILDKEIGELNFSHKLAPTIAHINRLSKLRLYNTCLQFNDSLTISYSKSPSELITDICKRIKVNTKLGEVQLKPIEIGELSKNVALSEWDYIDKICRENLEISKIYTKNDEIYSKIKQIYANNKNLKQISKENLNIYENLKSISASSLESYFKCPFYYFANNILKIRKREDSEIQSFDVGNILHELLFKYYSRKKNVGDIYEFCRNEVFAFIDKNERLKLKANSPVITNLIDESVRVINGLNYIDENSCFQPEPKLLEHKFYGESALKLKNIDIIGTVDRVDSYNNLLRIIDYKSGRANANLKELYYGNKLQLFLYSSAMENELKKQVVGGFYLPLHNAYTSLEQGGYALNGFFENSEEVVRALDKRLTPGEKSDIVNVKMTKQGTARKTNGYKELSPNEMNDMKNYAKQISEKAVDEIKSGFILPSPSGVSEPCRYCPYINVCLKSCNKIALRGASDVRLDSFGGENG